MSVPIRIEEEAPVSDEKDRKWENDELEGDDVEAHHKWGKPASDEPKQDDDGDDDVDAHMKFGKV